MLRAEHGRRTVSFDRSIIRGPEVDSSQLTNIQRQYASTAVYLYKIYTKQINALDLF